MIGTKAFFIAEYRVIASQCEHWLAIPKGFWPAFNIRRNMKRLINAPFQGMHRVIDMLCLNLGEIYQAKTIALGNRVISQNILPTFSLHIQTQWRFIHNNKIILGSRDIYTPYSGEIDEYEWDYSEVGRPDDESSVFDVVVKQLTKNLSGHFVTQCDLSPLGDIRIIFSNDYIFEVFIPASYQDEEWRLIDFSRDEHLIFYDVD